MLSIACQDFFCRKRLAPSAGPGEQSLRYSTGLLVAQRGLRPQSKIPDSRFKK
jgi:hypothetical protein